MSDIIQLLPDHVANQIAAGEVVQRPSSVAKELLENAVDASSTKIELIVRDAGRNLIQVVDNGIGMSETDARMSFERHATSKIRNTEDIFRILTKGFRGEALASITAVAQVELKTKKRGEEVGTQIYIEGGNVQFQEPVQTSEGSNLSVKNLFYNVPARRKFLKSNNVEFRHIIDEFQRVALAHSDIEFSLYHNDEDIFKLRKSNLLQRIVDVFGRKLQPQLIPIKEDLGWVQLNGFVAKPEGAKKTRGEQFFFVNGRFFKSPYLNRAVQDAFEGLLVHGYSPSFFLYLEIDPEKIDINIHPQKTEVKFEDENLIFALLRSTIKKSLGIYNIAPSLDFNRDPKKDIFFESKANQSSYKTPEIKVDRNYNPFSNENFGQKSAEKIDFEQLYQPSNAKPSKINLFEEENFVEDIMRLPNGYWLYNRGEETLVLNMTRINTVIFESQKKNYKRSNVGQSLLFSLEYFLNEIEKQKLKSVQKYFPELGFDVVLTQGNVLRINTIPEDLDEKEVVLFLEKMFDNLEIQSEEDFLEFYDEQWMSFHIASKRDILYKPEVERLIKDFIAIGFPQYTSSGKKCFVELSLDEIKTKFK